MHNTIEEINDLYFRDHAELVEQLKRKNEIIQELENRLLDLKLKKLRYDSRNNSED